jgi:hypothetical protein
MVPLGSSNARTAPVRGKMKTTQWGQTIDTVFGAGESAHATS